MELKELRYSQYKINKLTTKTNEQKAQRYENNNKKRL